MSNRLYYDLQYVKIIPTGRLVAEFVAKGDSPDDWPKQFELDMLLVSCLVCRKLRIQSNILGSDPIKLFTYASRDYIGFNEKQIALLLFFLAEKSAKVSMVTANDIQAEIENLAYKSDDYITQLIKAHRLQVCDYKPEFIRNADIARLVTKYTHWGLPELPGISGNFLDYPETHPYLQGIGQAMSCAGKNPIMDAYHAGLKFIESLRARESTPIFAYAP